MISWLNMTSGGEISLHHVVFHSSVSYLCWGSQDHSPDSVIRWEKSQDSEYSQTHGYDLLQQKDPKWSEQKQRHVG